MEKETIAKLNKSFEEYAYEQDGVDYWLARELQELLGYADWRNFLNAVDKAKESCQTTGEAVSDHFVDVTKMVKIGSGAERKQEDIMLTRYACYLIAQNGDPKKGQIAFAQSYFAIHVLKRKLIDHIETNFEVFKEYNDNKDFRDFFAGTMFQLMQRDFMKFNLNK
jgi:DNA-damage-inducible protein D